MSAEGKAVKLSQISITDRTRIFIREHPWREIREGYTLETVAKKALVEKQKRKPKYSTQRYNRCKICGRSGSYLKKFGMCRICFRNLALKGEIPGIQKSSW